MPRTSVYQYTMYDESNTRRTRDLRGSADSNASMQQYLDRRLPHGTRQSHESVDSALPAYEPPPPSVHSFIPANTIAELESETAGHYLSPPMSDGHDSDDDCNTFRPQQPQRTHEDENDVQLQSAVCSAIEGTERHNTCRLTAPAQAAGLASPPAYWDVAGQTEYGRIFGAQVVAVGNQANIATLGNPELAIIRQEEPDRPLHTFTQSMPNLLLRQLNSDETIAIPSEGHCAPINAAAISSNTVRNFSAGSAARTVSENVQLSRSHGRWNFNSARIRMRRSRLSATTNPEYRSTRQTSWLQRLLRM
ncbi:hypothetical protein H4R20_002046 [Coemansia guatemalensis]|uniref:Uncharacterized protein n=1 Tax=Coemansia guatemalensis TaxID=2761395 RepID=A0A9W8HYD4_9FUNG|nr:hypothetical protein H4R20_002046 [Coemansia guatemalensis]